MRAGLTEFGRARLLTPTGPAGHDFRLQPRLAIRHATLAGSMAPR
jgi:hypothetical protein